ncbi:MAG: putative dinucleotide-utilizing enzyme [Paracoccaceae bacterium]|jgi:predicted dinucleotide-utilizing enzyme
MIDVGSEFVCFWTQDDPQPMAGFRKRFPDVQRVAELARVLEDQSIDLVIVAAPPAARAKLTMQAMRHGKDVMLDKPGCLTLAELAKSKRASLKQVKSGASISQSPLKCPPSSSPTGFWPKGASAERTDGA